MSGAGADAGDGVSHSQTWKRVSLHRIIVIIEMSFF